LIAAGEPDAGGGTAIGIRLACLGIASAAADLGSVYWKSPFGPPGITAGDWVETIGTYAVLALYVWILWGLSTEDLPRERSARTPPPLAWFFIAWTTYALGRGVHVAANSIHDQIGAGASARLAGLAYLWDEHVGHSLVDFARAVFVLALTAIALRRPRGPRPASGPARIFAALGVFAYGFIYFATAVEGQTVPLALPFSVAYAVWGVVGARRSSTPVTAFFTGSSLISLLFFAIWGIWHHGFPEFSKAGLL
jgi:hypothetical protein